jgi:hypothetical protein
VRAAAFALGLTLCGDVFAADNLFAKPATPQELAALLAPAQKSLTQSQALRGTFQQRKFLAGIPKPLLSEGEFVFAREQGVWWHTTKPFDSEFVLTRAGMIQRDAGAAPIRLSAEQQPALRTVADVFLSLFSLDLGLLAQNFETYGHPTAKGWALGLLPHPGALGGVLRRAVVNGRERVELIELQDAHGDRTEISLIDDGRGGGPLGEAEAKRFQLP